MLAHIGLASAGALGLTAASGEKPAQGGCQGVDVAIAAKVIRSGCAVRLVFPRNVTEVGVAARRRRIALIFPILLVFTMYLAFHRLTVAFGLPLGYLVAFAVYWVGWCGLFPLIVLGRRGVLELFARSDTAFWQLGLRTHVLLWSPLVFPFFFAFVPRFETAGTPVLLVSVGLGIIIGVTEELLWRGVYFRLFPENVWANTVYPSIAFGVWHLCPLAVLPSRYPGGALLFLLYSVILGVCYATSVRTTGSIRWCIASHAVHDSLGLGAFAYAVWLK